MPCRGAGLSEAVADLRDDPLVAIGVVVRPHGRHGEVVVEPWSDRPERFPTLREAYAVGIAPVPERVRVERARPHKRRFVLKLAGVDSIDDAERYRGAELKIEAAELAPLPAGAYYHHELIGSRACDAGGETVGEVRAIVETGAVPVLSIDTVDGELLLPLIERFVTRVDTAAREVTVVVPEYTRADA